MEKLNRSKKAAKQRSQQPDSGSDSSRELSDEELDSVSGGKRHKGRGGTGPTYIEQFSWQMGSAIVLPGSSSGGDSAGKIDFSNFDVD